MDKTFDEIDNLFLDYFNENKEVPYSIQNTINHALDSEKKQNSLLEFIKALIITLIGIFTVTGGFVFARKVVNHYFNNNVGIDTAVQNGYIESVDSEYVESNNVKLKVKDFMMDDCNLNFEFEIFTNRDITNLNKIKFSNVLITDENYNILYSDSNDIINKYCEENNIKYDWKQYNKIFENIGCNPYIKEKYNSSVNYLYNLYGNDYPLSRKIKITIKNISFISETTETVDGNWELNIKVPEKFYNRNSTDYYVTSCSDPSLKILNAKLYDSCMKISFEFNIDEDDYYNSIINFVLSNVKEDDSNVEKQEQLNEINNQLISNKTLNALTKEFINNPFTNLYIEDSTGKKFYPTTSTSTDSNYSFYNNYIKGFETFSITKYNSTDTLKLILNYNNKNIEVDLKRS